MAASVIHEVGDIRMSAVAAMRLLQDGPVFAIEGDDQAAWANADHPMNNLPAGLAGVNMVNIDMRHHIAGGAGNPEYFANYILQKVLTCKAAFIAANPGKAFRWGLKNNTIGAPTDWNDGPDELPHFYAHPLDTPAGMFDSTRLVPLSHGFGTWVVRVRAGTTPSTTSFQIDTASDLTYRGMDWINKWPSDHLTKNPRFYFKWATGANAGQVHRVSGWNPATGEITLDTAAAVTPSVGDSGNLYTINDWSSAGAVLFYRNGSLELEAWTRRWMAEWVRLGAPGLVGQPVVYVVTCEDYHGASCWSAQAGRLFQANLASAQATDPLQHVDPQGHTLAQHYALFRKNKAGGNIDMDSNGSMFSPTSGAQNGYNAEVMGQCHAMWFQRGHFTPLEELWPDTYMAKYKVPNPVTTAELLPRPDSERFDEPDVGGVAPIKCGICFYDHYVLPIPAFRATLASAAGTVTTSGHTPTTTAFKVVDVDTVNNPITSKANDYWNNTWVRLNDGPASRNVRVVSDWDGTADVFTVSALPAAPTNGNSVSVLFENGTLIQEYNAGIGWDIYKSFTEWAGQPMDAAGLIETAKRWAADLAERMAERYPDAKMGSFHQTAGDTGAAAALTWFPFEHSWPDPEFQIASGYLSRADWADLCIRQAKRGQNFWVWFQPGTNQWANNVSGQADVVVHAMTAVKNWIAANATALAQIAGGTAPAAAAGRAQRPGRRTTATRRVLVLDLESLFGTAGGAGL